MDYATLSAGLTEAATLIGGDTSGEIEKLLALGEAVPVSVLKVQLDALQPQIDELKAKADAQEKITEKADELWGDWLDDFDDPTEDEINKYFALRKVQDKQTKQIKKEYKLRDASYLAVILRMLGDKRAEVEAAAEAAILPKKKSKSKGKVSGTRRAKGETDAWYKNAEADGKADYKKGMYACKSDIADKTIYEDNMKVFKVGEADPRNPAKTLTKDLTKYQYKGVVRDDPIQDEGNTNRCRGAVAWKAGRMGCKFAYNNGFKGSVMAQCSALNNGKGDFCEKCSTKQIDYFDKERKYTKANLPWCEAFGDECVKIE